MPSYDVVVLGLGGMGSAVLYSVARRGMSVLGIDQFNPPHDRGSSHGQTRVIRRAYFEAPDYVPLLHRSYDLWHELERETERELYCRTGLLVVGPPPGSVLTGVRRSTDLHALDIEDVPIAEVRRRFPGFEPDADAHAMYERDAGFLWVEECVRQYLGLAERHGAAIRRSTRVLDWQVVDSGIEVRTESELCRAQALVICAGPWSARVLGASALPLTVKRQPAFWFANEDPRYRRDRGCPVFFFETPAGFYYGFPDLGDGRVKVARHGGGESGIDADTVDHSLRPRDFEGVRGFLSKCLPGVSEQAVGHSVCMYTMTPDEHFIVDRHPDYENVFIAAGFSGHGFKFAPVIGKIMAEFVCEGRTAEPIAFLSLARFGDRRTAAGNAIVR